MFDIGFSELLVVGLVALIVLGPKRLPEVARTAGRWMGRLRRFVSEVKSDLDREMRNAEVMELQKLKQELDATRQVLEETSGTLVQQLTATGANDPVSAANPASELRIAPPGLSPKSGARAKRVSGRPRGKKKSQPKRHGRHQRAKRR